MYPECYSHTYFKVRALNTGDGVVSRHGAVISGHLDLIA
jgi:hypothetical protein